MNREDRAKQFLPFDALRGLREELKKREDAALRTARRQLSEEEAERLSHVLTGIRPRQTVKLVYYDNGHYRTVSGEVVACHTIYRQLVLIVNGVKQTVLFEDIYRLFLL